MIALLQTIATQSYMFNAGTLNATLPVLEPPAFEAPTWALRVNGLWFASLIVSLATASFGMLVKSWLREYLAAEQLAPQLRLRVRQYRYPALQKWKVFEIAAALPLLLQLALGLFFIGLCFFTAQINSRMSLTSLPLVAAWAFFFILTAIAPLVSPRCPFKLLLLKRTLKWARRWVRPVVLYLLKVPSRWHSFKLCLQKIVIFTTRGLSFIQIASTSKGVVEDEEDVIIAGGQEDTEILLSTDEMILDDSLLSIMSEALQQSRPDPAIAIKFIMRLISNRIPSYNEISLPLSVVLDLTGLSRQAYVAIMEMAIEVLRTFPGPLNKASPLWKKDAILLLLSSSPFPLPYSAYSVLSMCINDNDNNSPAGVELGRYLKESIRNHWPVHLFSLIPLEICHPSYLSNWNSVFQMYNLLLEEIVPTETSLIQTFQKYPQIAGNAAARGILESLWAHIIQIMKVETSHVAGHKYYLGSGECLDFAVNLAYSLGKMEQFAPIYGHWWTNGRWLRALSYFSAVSPQARTIADHNIMPIMRSIFKNMPWERESTNYTLRSKSQLTGHMGQCIRRSFQQLCALYMHTLKANTKSVPAMSRLT